MLCKVNARTVPVLTNSQWQVVHICGEHLGGAYLGRSDGNARAVEGVPVRLPQLVLTLLAVELPQKRNSRSLPPERWRQLPKTTFAIRW